MFSKTAPPVTVSPADNIINTYFTTDPQRAPPAGKLMAATKMAGNHALPSEAEEAVRKIDIKNLECSILENMTLLIQPIITNAFRQRCTSNLRC